MVLKCSRLCDSAVLICGNWYIWLNLIVKMMFDARSDNMLDSALQHPFKITDIEIHQKDALPVAA